MEIQLIERQASRFRLLAEGKEYVFMPPLSLFRHDRFLPMPLILKGITPGWRISSKQFLSYRQIKKAITKPARKGNQQHERTSNHFQHPNGAGPS